MKAKRRAKEGNAAELDAFLTKTDSRRLAEIFD